MEPPIHPDFHQIFVSTLPLFFLGGAILLLLGISSGIAYAVSFAFSGIRYRWVTPTTIITAFVGTALIISGITIVSRNAENQVSGLQAAVGWNYNVDISTAQAKALLTDQDLADDTTLGNTVIRVNGRVQRVNLYHINGEYLLGTENRAGTVTEIKPNMDS